MKKVIYVFSIYDSSASFINYTLPTVAAYANNVEADIRLILDKSQISDRYPKSQRIIKAGESFAHFYKLHAIEDFVYSQYDKMMLIDDDILVRNSALDLFNLHQDGHFLASQHIGQSGANYLAVHTEENNIVTWGSEKCHQLSLKYINRNLESCETGLFLESNLRNIINSGLYVIDRETVNFNPQLLSREMFEHTRFGWHDQGYLVEALGDCRIPLQEIPERVHANPLRTPNKAERESLKDRNTDFYHFNGMPKEKKEIEIEKYFKNNFKKFCTPVIVMAKA